MFVIDGAHRLSALIAWVHDDYGDGDRSRKFFQGSIPDEQARAADRVRTLVNDSIGSYGEHKTALEFPNSAKPEVAARAARLGWHNIPVQWIVNADHEKAEKAFFRINQGGTKIDATEQRILNARDSATALAARAILRGGTGHRYWKKFSVEQHAKIEVLGKEIFQLLFEPTLQLPIKTLDVPMAGPGYGPHVLPFLFDLVNLTNKVAVADSSNKRIKGDEGLNTDTDGNATINYLSETRRALWRLCSTNPSSLGLHPALYFYSPSGAFQAGALLSFVALFKEWDTQEFRNFISVRKEFEDFLLANRGITEAVRKLGSGSRSRPRLISLYRRIIDDLLGGKTRQEIAAALASDEEYQFMVAAPALPIPPPPGKFSRDVKGAAFVRDALPTASRCPTCGGIMHRNGMQAGHREAHRDGGSGTVANAMMQHPFCNSTVAN